MSNSQPDDDFRGHHFFFVGDSGKLYHLSSQEVMQHEMTKDEDPESYDYFKNLADNEGAVLTLRQPSDANVLICFLLNCRAIRTEWRPEEAD
jgi:hypothetical protein